MLSVDGVGLVTVAGFISEVGDISRFKNPKQIQKYAGFELVENSSGKHKGRTTISKRGANILRNATKNSLLILDEIGRGTSTFDGLSIAWAVVEYISNSKLLGAKTLFATHYHELTELEGKIDSVHNYCIAVKEQGDDIVFLRKIVKGGADKSYGVQVAKLAGVPDAVINRAKEIARELEEHDLTSGAKDIMPYGEAQQLSFFRESDEPTMEHPFMAELREKDLSDMTPLEALNYLYVLQEKLKNEE